MKVLMLYPEYPVTFWSYKHILKYISKKAAYPPLGLLTVAAMLPKDWSIRLIDLNTDTVGKEDYEWADTVMISAMLIQEKSVLAIIDECRRYGKPIIAGGPLFNSLPDAYLDRVDHLVLGEAEASLPSFLEDFKNGTARKVYVPDSYPSLAATPLPRWELVDTRKYATMAIQYSRGCPNDCEFCDITVLYGRKPRTKSGDQLLSELQTIYDLGWRGTVFIVDDNFIGNKRAVKRVLPEMVSWTRAHAYPFTFMTEATINIADDDELIRLMVDAGFDSVFIGFESPEEASLEECSKNQNRQRDMIASVKKLQSSGLQVMGGYIVGFDHDDEGIFAKQIKFIQESGVVAAMVNLLNVIPKTRLWQRLEEENRLGEKPAFEAAWGSALNFIPRMDREKLIEGYRSIMQTIYSPGFYYQRICNFLETYRPSKTRKRIDLYRVKAFIHSLFSVGLLGERSSRLYYWKLLFKSIFLYRHSFPDVVALIISGVHFRKLMKEI